MWGLVFPADVVMLCYMQGQDVCNDQGGGTASSAASRSRGYLLGCACMYVALPKHCW